ncbi:pyridoxal phosphate-dependent decarboxylase family protein [Streptomyces hoynatensis]|uniref:pyridoxal phosphate-dependent decarboxylase family protein n=1 Tax=Streptomyces hoynatensis TaxID=1141874 RepID=UPI000EA85F23|nr:aminotransferase class V-fold PLP-dependent enzyme [Streptomyces hoynatensis]
MARLAAPGLVEEAARRLAAYWREVPGLAPGRAESARGLAERLAAPPGEEPGDGERLLDLLGRAVGAGEETGSPRHLAYIPSAGLPASAVGALLAAGFNRVTAIPDLSPAMIALEDGLLRWLCGVFGLPAGAIGTLQTGASLSTLTAVVAAREDRLGEATARATAYTTVHTHEVARRALRVAGLPPSCLRTVPTTGDLRMDPAAASRLIEADRRAGRTPFLLLANAGTAVSGTVDPLPELAALARREGLWLHVDAAYGGGFRLTERGRRRLAGIEQADSLCVDAHKSLFAPFGAGVLLVRDAATLRRAFALEADCMAEVSGGGDLPTYSDLGPELSRESRALRLWLPLHLHGLRAFREVLDRMLDLAAEAHRALGAHPALRAGPVPDLSIVTFRLRHGGDRANRDLLRRVNATGALRLGGAPVNGRFSLRMCLLHPQLDRSALREMVRVIARAL